MLARNIIADGHSGLPQNTGSLHLVVQPVVDVFTAPAAGNNVTVINPIAISLAAERLTKETKTAGSRVPRGTLAGRKRAQTVTVETQPKAPRVLGGTDTWDITTLMQGLCGGAEQRVNSQALVDIESIVSYATDGTSMVINVDTNATTFSTPLASFGPYPLYHESNNAASTHGTHHAVLCVAVADQGGGGAGGCDLTLKNMPLAHPVAADDPLVGANPDQVYLGGFWPVTDDFSTLYSGVSMDGNMAFDFLNAKVGKGTFETGADGLFKATFDLMVPRGWRNPSAFILGATSTATFTTTDTVLRVTTSDALALGAARFVNLVKKSTTTRLVTATETKAEIDADATDFVNGLITFAARGTTPIDATVGLSAVTTVTQERNGNYNIPSGGYMIAQLMRGEQIRIPLTAGAARTATQVVADCVNYIRTNEHYGVNRKGAVKADYTTCFFVSGTAVGMRTPVTGAVNAVSGYQAQIALIDDGAALNVGDLVFDLFFELVATDHVEIEPWAPAATETRQEAANWRGRAIYRGYQYNAESLPLSIDNGLVEVHVKDGTQYAAQIIEAPQRSASFAIAQPFWHWLQSIFQMVDDHSGGVLNVNIGDEFGGTFSVHALSAVPGEASVDSGTPRKLSYTVMCEDPGSGWAEFVVGHG